MQRLEPEYAAAAKELKADGIAIAKVDATENKKLAERFGVSGEGNPPPSAHPSCDLTTRPPRPPRPHPPPLRSPSLPYPGFPTLKYFKGGKAGEYNGGRVKAEIVSWLRKRAE